MRPKRKILCYHIVAELFFLLYILYKSVIQKNNLIKKNNLARNKNRLSCYQISFLIIIIYIRERDKNNFRVFNFSYIYIFIEIKNMLFYIFELII